jgi:glycosyltransferase involved in cell wall biosynthesis
MEYYNAVKYHHVYANLDRWTSWVISGALNRFPSFSRVRLKRPLFDSILSYFTYILQVAENIRAEKCDIIQISEESQLVPAIRAINPQAKIVLYMHSELLTQLDPTMIAKRLEKVDLIIGCSDYITEKIRRTFPQFAQRCRTVHPGVDTHKFFNPSSRSYPKRILFVSRVTPEKGLHVLVDALGKVVEKYPSIHLDVVGPQAMWDVDFLIRLSDDPKVRRLVSFHLKGQRNSYNNYLRNRLHSLGISRNVTFHGIVSHDEIIKYYQNADLFVLPSFTEAFGMGLIEAMACELPVVATKVGGIPEIVENGRNGLLVESGDPEELSEAILSVFSDSDQRELMGKRARERAVQFFSWEKIADNMSILYEFIRNSDK